MAIMRNLRLWLRPPKMSDPDFGDLVFMHVSNAPERSYWECEWMFPPTGEKVFIALQGPENGPSAESRKFYLSLPPRFEEVIAACGPRLERVFKEWLQKPLPADLFSELKLVGFEVENPGSKPLHWEVSFETKGDEWLGITIPFVDTTPLEAQVDT